MLTIRANNSPPKVKLTKKGADFTVQAAVDVYVVCNSSEGSSPPGATVDSVCDDTMPLALTLGIVSYYTELAWDSSYHSETCRVAY